MAPWPPTGGPHRPPRLHGLAFDDAYGYTWGRNIIGGARDAVEASFDRYLRAIQDEPPLPAQEIE